LPPSAGLWVTKSQTIAEYLKYWLAEIINPNREDATYTHYEAMSRLYIIPGLGKKRIDKLTLRETQAWLNKIPGTCQCCAQEKDAKRRKPKCCAAGECCEDFPGRRVIEACRGTLRAALNHAIREELISRNVAELATLPKPRKRTGARTHGPSTKPASSSNAHATKTTRSTRCGC
jgi:hypothetical protein